MSEPQMQAASVGAANVVEPLIVLSVPVYFANRYAESGRQIVSEIIHF